jgi:hypothetical protein
MLPLIRQSPFYPGQFGVSGSDVQRGMRWSPTAIVLYVDENHPGATATADGTDPEHPLTTITLAIARLISFQTSMAVSLVGSVIVVGAGATIAESVVIPATAPKDCMILGAGYGVDAPRWTAATAAGTALTVRQSGWVIKGFRFNTGDAGTAIRLEWVPGSGYVGNRTLIEGNYFDGQYVGKYAIDLNGAPYDTWIIGNSFREYKSGQGAAFAIYCSGSSEADPYMNVIRDNIFWENENHVGSLNHDYGFNVSIIQGNVFKTGIGITTTLFLDLRGGSVGENTVTQNIFEGDYSNTGGYYAHAAAPGNWVGNLAEDTAEPEVSATGITIAPPAA